MPYATMRASISPTDAAALIPDGASVMIGGFMGVGTPARIIDALIERGACDLTVIAAAAPSCRSPASSPTTPPVRASGSGG